MDEIINEPKDIIISQHPWRRYFARSVDIGVVSSVLFVPYSIFLNNIRFSYFESVLRTLIIMFSLFIIESLMLTGFGTTIGKWILNIRIEKVSESKIDFRNAVKRSFYVYMSGVGFGIPIISIFTELNSYDELQDNGITSWDKKAGTKVVFGRINILRIIIAVILFISPVLIAAMTSILT